MSSSEQVPKNQQAPTHQPEEDHYEPWKNRNVPHPLGFIGSLLHMLKGSLGTGILSMPMAFKNGGLWAGLVGSIVVGIIYTHCVHIMIRSSQVLCVKVKKPDLGYSQVAENAFKTGAAKIRRLTPFVKQGIDISLFLDYYLCCVVYILFTAHTLKQVLELHVDWTLDVRLYILVVVFAMLPLAMISNLKYLVPFSFVAICTLCFGCGFVLYLCFKDLPSPSSRPVFTSPIEFSTLLSTVIFAMDGIGTVLPIEHDMRDPSNMLGCPGVLNLSMGSLIIAYSSIGFIGYLRYGDDILGTITLNIQSSFFNLHATRFDSHCIIFGMDSPLALSFVVIGQVVKMMVTINVFLSFGLFFYVICDVIWRRIESIITDNNRSFIYYGMRVVLTILAGLIAALVPDLEIVIGIVGSVCASTVILFFPPIIEMATFWDDRAYMGPFHWKIYKNIFIMILWFLTLVSGVGQSVAKIIKLYSNEEKTTYF